MNKPHMVELTRALRHSGTPAERVLWKQLQNKQMNGIKFRRQEPIGDYIVDFVSFEKKLIIEIDGGQHNEGQVVDKDNARTRWCPAGRS